jgi:phosphoserine phosphatase
VPCHVSQLLLAKHKVEITLALLSERGLTTSDCVAYGDSFSDIELFRVLDRTLAINARPFIRELAAETYDGEDMWRAYEIGRSLLERPSAARFETGRRLT